MKAKNAKVGTKVVVKKGVVTDWYKECQTGTISATGNVGLVWVDFDHDGEWWSVELSELKLLNKKEKQDD